MRLAALLVFVAACAPVPAGMMMMTPVDSGPQPTACTVPASSALTNGYFVDVSEHSGLTKNNFVPMPATAIPINDHSRLAFVDIDGDGFDDAVMHSLFPNPQKGIPFEHLIFLNQRDGTFKDVSAESGLKDVQSAFLVFGDFDNDGDEDCFAGLDIPLAGKTSQVLLNDGAGHFARKANAGVEQLDIVANAVLADFNHDGKLDLFSGNGSTSYGVPNVLLFGNGDGSFTDVTAQQLKSPVPAVPTNGLVACDYDNDGDQDIFVSTYGVSVNNGWDQLWVNDGNGAFYDLASLSNFHAQATGNYFNSQTGYGRESEPGDGRVGGNGFGIDCGDVNGDGLQDIFIAAISHADGSEYTRLWSDPTQLLINQGPATQFAFKNEFLDRGLPFNEGDIDAAMVDFDNDGRLDLALTRTEKYEASFPDVAQKGWFGLFHQKADGNFESEVERSGINEAPVDAASPAKKNMKGGQNLAFADIDHDGDADLLVGGRDQGGGRANHLFENHAGSQSLWLAVQLQGDGVNVPRDAFGSRVTLRIGDKVQLREKKSSRGTYDSIDGSSLLFGLGDVGACTDGKNRVTLEVRWSDGRVDTYGPEAFELSHYVKASYAEKSLKALVR